MAFSTDVQIRNWKPTGRQAKPCGNRLGLYVRSNTRGQKAFYWRKGSFYKLGDYPALSFADAKAMAAVCTARAKEGLAPETIVAALRHTDSIEATAGDRDLMRFLQQVAGYCLTGSTREHALFFIYGPGGNGKSVFLNLLNYVLGDYATTAGMETFTASKNDRHPTDLAMLNGARLVSASETEEGRAWAAQIFG